MNICCNCGSEYNCKENCETCGCKENHTKTKYAYKSSLNFEKYFNADGPQTITTEDIKKCTNNAVEFDRFQAIHYEFTGKKLPALTDEEIDKISEKFKTVDKLYLRSRRTLPVSLYVRNGDDITG